MLKKSTITILRLVFLKAAKYPRVVNFIEKICFNLFSVLFKGRPRYEAWKRSKSHTEFRAGFIKDTVNYKTKINKHSIVVIDHIVPQYDKDAGSRTLTQWMKIFSSEGMDTYFFPQNCLYDPIYSEHLEKMGISTIHDTSFKKWIKSYGHSIRYFLLSRPDVSIGYISCIKKFSNAKIIYYGHDIHFLRLESKLKNNTTEKLLVYEKRIIEKIEKKIWSYADVIYYPSNEETDYVSNFLRKNDIVSVAQTIPVYAFDEFLDDSFINLHNRTDILFVGSFAHSPNEDGVIWLVKHIMPIVWKTLPDVCINLVGSNATQRIKNLQGDKVFIRGYVDDSSLQEYYSNSRISVAPLTFGGGVKGKIIESMRFGLPIVTTSIGLQGLSHVSDCLLSTDSKNEFAKYMLDLLTDDKKWLLISKQQVKLSQRFFSVKETKKVFSKHIDLLAKT